MGNEWEGFRVATAAIGGRKSRHHLTTPDVDVCTAQMQRGPDGVRDVEPAHQENRIRSQAEDPSDRRRAYSSYRPGRPGRSSSSASSYSSSRSTNSSSK